MLLTYCTPCDIFIFWRFCIVTFSFHPIQASGKVEALTVKRMRSLSSEVTKLKGRLKSLQVQQYSTTSVTCVFAVVCYCISVPAVLCGTRGGGGGGVLVLMLGAFGVFYEGCYRLPIRVPLLHHRHRHVAAGSIRSPYLPVALPTLLPHSLPAVRSSSELPEDI